MNTVLLKKNFNREVVVIDAKGINHKGKLVGVSSVNKNNALVLIGSKKLMEVSMSFIKGV